MVRASPKAPTEPRPRHHPTTSILIGSLLLLLVSAGLVAEEVEVIALDGQPASGTTGSFFLGRPTFSLPSPLPPLIDGSGRVAFYAFAEGPEGVFRPGIWAGSEDPDFLAIEGQVLPGYPGCDPGSFSCEIFNIRPTLYLAPGGEVTMRLSREDGLGPFGGGSQAWIHGRSHADLLPVVTSVETEEPFDASVGLQAALDAHLVGRFYGTAPFGEPGGITDFASPLIGGAAPGISGQTIVDVIGSKVETSYGPFFSFDDEGALMLVAELSNGERALYRSSAAASAPLSLLAHTTGEAPGIAGAQLTSLTFSTTAGTAGHALLNDAGYGAFRADWNNDADATPRKGVWRVRPDGTVELVAAEWRWPPTDPVFETSEGSRTAFRDTALVPNQFVGLRLAPNGDVFFYAGGWQVDSEGGLIPDSERLGLWHAPADGGPIQLLFTERDPDIGLPGTPMPKGGEFAASSLSFYGFDETGRLVLGAQVVVGGSLEEGIYATVLPVGEPDFEQSLKRIAITGEEIEVASGDFRTIADLDFNSVSFGGATTGSFRQSRLAFTARFEDGSRAILAGCPGYVVNSTADDLGDQNPGDDLCDTGRMVEGLPECTLRAAIQEANARPGIQTIRFGIPESEATNGVYAIEVAQSLPILTDPAILDATSQPGYQAGAPVIELNAPQGDKQLSGLDVRAGDSTIRGFSIYGFGRSGIILTQGGGNVIAANIVGTNAQSLPDVGNGEDGIAILGSSENVIGGSAPADRNVVSGNGIAATGGCGLRIDEGSDNEVLGNYFGPDIAGTADLSVSQRGGVCLIDAPFNWIGGVGPGEGNLLSGNRFGVYVSGLGSVSNRILGNVAGLDRTGADLLGNDEHGVAMVGAGSGNVVGNGQADGRNVLSGNGTAGIAVRLGSGFNFIDGNFVGTNSAGDAPRPNDVGILIQESPASSIGVSGANVVSGNTGHGIFVQGAAASTTQIQDNLIGLDLSGLPMPNGLDGVRLSGARAAVVNGNFISENGGSGVAILGAEDGEVPTTDQSDAGHVVSSNWIGAGLGGGARGNGIDGVLIRGSSGNRIVGNTIRSNGSMGIGILFAVYGDRNVLTGNAVFDNAALGIDLDRDFLTANDPGDADTGANALQNHPLITEVVGAPLNLLEGTLQSAPNRSFTIEVFSNPAADPSGSGEGQVFEDSVTVTTDADGDGLFMAGFGQGVAGHCLTATARDTLTGDTSEFSSCVPIPPPPPPSGLGVDFGDAPDLDGRYPTLLSSNGARHAASTGLFLGERIDGETDGQPSADATGDDTDGSQDERGVSFGGILWAGLPASIDVSANATGHLDAWIDFDGNGDWADPSDQIFAAEPLQPGVNRLDFPVPVGARHGQTFARFRFSTDGDLGPSGPARNGEVEDYAVGIFQLSIFFDDFEAGSTAAWSRTTP